VPAIASVCVHGTPRGMLCAAMSRRPRLALVAALAFCGACKDDAQFTTRFASDFAPGGHALSVLGVFKDGQMSSESWDAIGPRLSSPFGATCDTAYGRLVTADQALSTAIDDYVRANGPGDELLEQLAPAATGDVIVVFTVAGHVNDKEKTSTPTASAVSNGAPMAGNGGRGHGMRGGAINGEHGIPRPSTAPSFEVAASLYSVREKRSVGMLTLQYDGNSLDEALQRMAARLGVAVPGAKCGGWDFTARIDDKRIRALIEE
jgi:hypothetical protein